MALLRDDAGRTEKPTPFRLAEARDKGHVPLSRELVMSGTLIVGVLAVEHLGAWLLDAFRTILVHGLDVKVATEDALGTQPGLLREVFAALVRVAAPFLAIGAICLLAIAAFGYGQIGFRWSPQALRWRFERLDPVANLGRLFSLQSLARTALSLAKLLVLGGVLWLVLRSRWAHLATLHAYEDVGISLGLIAEMALAVLFWIAVTVLLISLGDVAWQRFDYQRSLMMTKQEVEDERKRAEGDPMVRTRLKQARFELMRQRMMAALPKADVVITNPTHFSVALKYDRARHAAPEVVAKGADELALRIREVAKAAGVPLLEDPPLARALFRAVKVGQQVPPKFYAAVAAVLGTVYRLRGRVA
jgi:flagellar biosynthetic protein FlhB